MMTMKRLTKEAWFETHIGRLALHFLSSFVVICDNGIQPLDRGAILDLKHVLYTMIVPTQFLLPASISKAMRGVALSEDSSAKS